MIILHEAALLLAKTSILLLYWRIFSCQKTSRILIRVTIALCALIFIFVAIGDCYSHTPSLGQPWAAQNIAPLSTDRLSATVVVIRVSGLAVLILDILIFLIPIYAIWGIPATVAWKSKVYAVFLTGLL
jgi:hypothetical protein